MPTVHCPGLTGIEGSQEYHSAVHAVSSVFDADARGIVIKGVHQHWENTRLKSVGASMQPCLTPLETGKALEVSLSSIIPSWNCLTMVVNFSRQPNFSNSWESLAQDRPSWRSQIHSGAQAAEAGRTAIAEERRTLRKARNASTTFADCAHFRARIGLYSHLRTHQTRNTSHS